MKRTTTAVMMSLLLLAALPVRAESPYPSPIKPEQKRKARTKVLLKEVPPQDRAVVARRRGAFRACYVREVLKNPTLQGKVVLSVQIPPEGHPPKTSVLEDTIGVPEILTCLVRQVRRLRFQPRDAAVSFDLPMIFIVSD